MTIKIDDGGGRYYFDHAAADIACEFFPRFCTHGKGSFAGKPLDLMDYQVQLILRPLFGWKRKADGLRRFQKTYIELPKKNGKTQLIAALGLYMLLCDREPGAEIYCAAADKKQAQILFDAAKEMIRVNPKLGSMCEVFRSSIVKKDDPGAFFQVLSREAATKHGPNIHCLIIDELHAQPDRELFETLTRGVIARSQPLIVEITTAGDDDESICFEEYDYAKRVLSGTIQDEKHLPVIFEAGATEDWTDPAIWHRVNPGLGHTIPVDKFEGFALEAQNEPRKRNDFLRYHLNRWVNQAVAWLPIEWWDECKGKLDDAELATMTCAAGLDMAQKIDLVAFVVTFGQFLPGAPEELVEVAAEDPAAAPVTHSLNYRVFVRPYFWLPEETCRDREKEGVTSYRSWAEAGLLTLTEGGAIDYDRVYKDIVAIGARYPLMKQGQIGYDPAFATDIANRLRDKAGFTTAEILQNYQHMNEPCHVFEALVKTKRIVQDGHRLMRWNVENVAVKRDDAGRIRPVKPRQQAKKIDGVVATLMGVGGLMRTMATAPNRSVYEERDGLLSF